MKELRPYQATTIENIRDSLRNGVKRMVVQGPCGFGKTLIAATIAKGAMAKNKRMAFVCPAISLIDQTVHAFWEEGCRDIGVIQSDHALTNWDKPIQVCSIQTIASRKAFPRADIVVLDEIHSCFDAHKKWLTDSEWANVPFIGLTATPWSKGLGKYFDSLLVAATTNDLIQQGYLSKFRVFAKDAPDLSKVKIVAGDYHESQLSDAMQEGTLTADIISTWEKCWGKDKTFVFAVDVAHAQALQARFLAAGISCAFQDARTPILERAEIKKKFHSGEYRVISNVDTLSVGVDYDVRCIVMARPTRSEIKYVQIIGRGLRMAPGKEYLTILDHSDTTQNLGFISDIHHERLHNGKPSEKAERKPPPLPKPCPQCTCMLPRVNKVCQNCGFEMKVISGVVERDGELVDVTAGERGPRGGKKQYTMAEKEKFYAMLLGHAATKGYKLGWSANQYRSKFHVWPNSMSHVRPMTPDVVMVSWLRSRQIAWAKSQRRTEKTTYGDKLTPRQEQIIANVAAQATPSTLMTPDDDQDFVR